MAGGLTEGGGGAWGLIRARGGSVGTAGGKRAGWSTEERGDAGGLAEAGAPSGTGASSASAELPTVDLGAMPLGVGVGWRSSGGPGAVEGGSAEGGRRGGAAREGSAMWGLGGGAARAGWAEGTRGGCTARRRGTV